MRNNKAAGDGYRAKGEATLKRVIWLAVFALLMPVVAHADSMVFDFTVTHLQFDNLDDPSTYTYQRGTFSLVQGQMPDHVSIDHSAPLSPMFENMMYQNIPYTMTSTKNGVVLPLSSGVGTVTFWWDGIELPNGFHVFNSPLPFDRDDPYHPEFVAGHYTNGNDLFAWYDVTAQTPEPSTWMLLGTGLTGGVGLLRRRRLHAW
jgi:hypothetical protein